jgi:hypothetical protein
MDHTEGHFEASPIEPLCLGRTSAAVIRRSDQRYPKVQNGEDPSTGF